MLERDTSKLEAVKAPFPRLHYDEAAKILLDKGLPFQVGGDLGGTDETVLSEQFDRPVCVTHYPAAIKAFYMKPDPNEPDQRAVRRRAGARRLRRDHRRRPAPRRSTICCCSASRNTTCRRKRSSGISICAATASVPHGGFGMGIERCVSWICGLEHVRETIPYPRMLYRIYP